MQVLQKEGLKYVLLFAQPQVSSVCTTFVVSDAFLCQAPENGSNIYLFVN